MNDHDHSKAEEDVIATTDSYGGPVSQDELAEVYLAPKGADVAAPGAAEDSPPADVDSDPAKDDEQGSDWSDEGGATPQGPATDSPAV